MPKNTKTRKSRTYQVHSDFNGLPFIRFGGKYLTQELGLTYGDRLELTPVENGILLRKFSIDELTQYETERKKKTSLKQLFMPLPTSLSRRDKKSIGMMVTESQSFAYHVDEEIQRHYER